MIGICGDGASVGFLTDKPDTEKYENDRSEQLDGTAVAIDKLLDDGEAESGQKTINQVGDSGPDSCV